MKQLLKLISASALVLVLVAAFSQAGEEPNTLTKEEKKAGWKLLFDGKSTKGWRNYLKKDVQGWEAVDGSLVRTGKGGDLITNDEFQNFELQIEWKIEEGGNSGVMFHVAEDEKFKNTYETGPEMQVLDNDKHPDGKITKHRAGDNYDLQSSASDPVKPVGEFNQAKLVVNNGKVEHWLNGVKVIEYTLWSPEWEEALSKSKFATWPGYGKYKKGHIALQDHGNKVWFRNIKIRPL